MARPCAQVIERGGSGVGGRAGRAPVQHWRVAPGFRLMTSGGSTPMLRHRMRPMWTVLYWRGGGQDLSVHLPALPGLWDPLASIRALNRPQLALWEKPVGDASGTVYFRWVLSKMGEGPS